MTSTPMLERFKIAKLTTKLKPHQQRVVDRMEDEDQPGLVAVHGLGSGKTLTSIAVQEALGMPSDVVAPAALLANYKKEIKAHTSRPQASNVQSLEGVARTGGHGLKNPLLIVDEAHRVRNAGKASQGLAASKATKRLALTGSLLVNYPSDVSRPLNFVAGKKVLPEDPDEFAAQFLRDTPNARSLVDRFRNTPTSYRTTLNPRGVGVLRAALDKYVDYHPGTADNFPTREDAVIKVPMTDRQLRVYSNILEDMPKGLRRKMLMNLPPSRAEATQLNAFMSGARQVSNTTQGFDVDAPQQPKIDRAVAELQKVLAANPRAKAIVYSHFLESGLAPYTKKLDDLKIPYGTFTGDMLPKQRERMVSDYNAGKIKALLLSSAGGEGLDTKGTRLIQLLEPHFNKAKLDQVIGRGIRYKSHTALPENERTVLVQRFLATRPRSGMLERLHLRNPGFGADEYLDAMSSRKDQLNKQVMQLLQRHDDD